MIDLEALEACQKAAPSKLLALRAYVLWAVAQKCGWRQAREQFSNGGYYRCLHVLRAAGLWARGSVPAPAPRVSLRPEKESAHSWLLRLPGTWFCVTRSFDELFPIGLHGQIQAVCLEASGWEVRVVPWYDPTDRTELPVQEFFPCVRLLDTAPPQSARLTHAQVLQTAGLISAEVATTLS